MSIEAVRQQLATAAKALADSAKLARSLEGPVAGAAAFAAKIRERAPAMAAELTAAGFIDAARADKLACEIIEDPTRLFDVVSFVAGNPVDRLGRADNPSKTAAGAADGAPKDAFEIWSATGSPPPVRRW